MTIATNVITDEAGSGSPSFPNGVRALQSGTAQVASGTAVDFTGIPSWAKRITVMFSGVSPSGVASILVQLGDSGGIENTGYICSLVQVGSAGVSSTAGFLATGGAAASTLLYGHATLTKLDGNTWIYSGNYARSDAVLTIISAGNKTLSDVLTQVRIATSNGIDTFDAGSISILVE